MYVSNVQQYHEDHPMAMWNQQGGYQPRNVGQVRRWDSEVDLSNLANGSHGGQTMQHQPGVHFDGLAAMDLVGVQPSAAVQPVVGASGHLQASGIQQAEIMLPRPS